MIREAEEKMCIYLSQKPNEHLLILGQSGTGKTYFGVRRIEEAIRNNNRSLYLIIPEASRCMNYNRHVLRIVGK